MVWSPVAWGLLVLAWIAGVAAAAVPLVRHQLTPGAPAETAAWPATSPLGRAPDRLTLVLAAHARCPCAWASLDELSEILARAPGGLRAYVIVATPPGVPADDRLAERARRLAGVTVITDDGAEARRFGAATSGQVLVFDPAGRRLFAGGITGSRGHRGENAGSDAVIALARGRTPATGSTPVFGCPLADPLAACPRCAAEPAP